MINHKARRQSRANLAAQGQISWTRLALECEYHEAEVVLGYDTTAELIMVLITLHIPLPLGNSRTRRRLPASQPASLPARKGTSSPSKPAGRVP